MTAFHFDEPSHIYTLDGARLPSVTQLLAPIKPDFSMVPPDVLERKRALGVAVHLACELDDLDELDDDSTDPVVMQYVAGWRKFRADTGAAIVANEQRLFHPSMRFAGTIDRVAYLRMRDDAEPSTWLIDLKTCGEPHPSFGVQLAGYELLLKGFADDIGVANVAARPGAPAFNPERMRRATVHLRDDGTYRLHQFQNPNDAACFIACLSLFQWKESHQ